MDDVSADVSPRRPAAGRTPTEWARITDLLGETLDLTGEARRRFLESLRIQNPAAAAEVESLLAEHERPGEFLLDFPPQPDAYSDLSGRILGSYRLISLLGCGGMGAVYLAERSDGAFTKQVAVKLLSPAVAHGRGRFHREREVLARLEHRNIARLLDGGTTPEGWPYLVMEYVNGIPIDRYCEEHNLSIDARLGLLRQVCAGVAHAHQRLIIHCDIKPENILVTADGTPKLLDFGIAKLLELDRQLTQFRPATPAFSSPEQLQGDALTTASDVYAIGVLAYVLLTGSWPYPMRSSRIVETMQAVLTAEPIPASRIAGLQPARARRMRGDIDNILLKAVAKDPGRRYASAQELANDLDAFRHGFPVKARPDTLAYRIRRFAGRHRLGTAAAFVSLASLTAATGFSAWQARVAEQRFNDLREFARAVVFDVSDSLMPIPGTTAARKLLVETALRYLDRLAQQRSSDPSLREELAAAYIRVARVQGGAFLPNLGDTTGAMESFRKAIAVVGTAPVTPQLERLRIEAYISLGELASDPIHATPDLEEAIAAAERHLASNPDDIAMLRLLAQAYHARATNGHLTDDVPAHEGAAVRAIEIRERILALAPGQWRDEMDLAREHSQHSLALLQRSDPAGGLAKLRVAQRLLGQSLKSSPGNQVILRELGAVHSRAGAMLLALGALAESSAELQRAVALFEPLVAADPNNAQYAAELSMAWYRLGNTRRAEGRLSEAVDLHRRALEIARARAQQDSTFMFVRWSLAMSLTALGETLLGMSPANWREARALFIETRDLVEPLIAQAPSFNELRRQLAASYEGIGRAELAAYGPHSPSAHAALDKALEGWREVFARSKGDHRQINRLQDLERLAAALPRD